MFLYRMALQIAISKMSGAEKGGGGKESEGEKNNGGSSQHLQEKDLENQSLYMCTYSSVLAEQYLIKWFITTFAGENLEGKTLLKVPIFFSI